VEVPLLIPHMADIGTRIVLSLVGEAGDIFSGIAYVTGIMETSDLFKKFRRNYFLQGFGALTKKEKRKCND